MLKIPERILNSVDGKIKQYDRCVKNNTVDSKIPFVISISFCNFPERGDAWSFFSRPHLVAGLFLAFGAPTIRISCDTLQSIDKEAFLPHKPESNKKNGAPISLEIFRNHPQISAVILSMSCFECETDFQIIYNPFATNPLPLEMVNAYRHIMLSEENEEYLLTVLDSI